MSAKKSTLSAQPDSSEITAPPLTVITNPSPAATLSSAPSHQLSFSAPPSEAASSQVNASTVMQNDSQPTAPSDAVPSSRGIVTPSALIPTTSQTTASPPTQPPSSSTPSSSRLPKASDYAETIMEAVKELDKENVDGDFSDLINYISRLLDFIEEKKKGKNQSMPKAAEGSCLASKNFLRLKDVVSEGVNAVIDMRPRKGQELKYPEYPKGAAVGIEKQLEKVIAMLEMESDKNAVAVIVHGVVGMAKTTLADALFDAKREGYKYAKVRLFDDIASVPDVVKLQRCILTALMKGEESEIPEIRRYEEGQQVIEDMLEEEAAFIYIDNVLLPDKVEQGRDALRHLLPKNMRNARKLRLLLTTTDKDAVRIRGVKPVFYPIEGLPHEEARDSDPPFDVSKLKEFKKLSHLICKSEDLENLSEEKKKGENQSMPKAAVGSCLASEKISRLKDVVSEGDNAVKTVMQGGDEKKDIVTVDGKTFLMGFLKGMGMAHMVTTGFLLAAYILERHEAVSENKEACLYLLREMNILADHVQQLQQQPMLKKRMEAPIREATMLIVEASIDCCTQIGASSFFSATVNGEALAKFQKRLADTHSHMQDGMGLGQFDLFNHLEQGLSNVENLLKQLQSKFDSMLTNGEREPLNISGLPLNTLLLVMFDGEQEFCPDFPLPLLEESIDDIQTNLKMVYFGNHFKKLPEKVAEKIVGHAPADGDAKALFQKLLSLVVHDETDFDGYLTSSFQMTAEIVTGEKGDKYLSRWKIFEGEDDKVEDFVVTKCGRYLKLKQLAERPGGSPIALLTELFRGGEEEVSLSFLKNKDGESTKVGVDELPGKTILLDIRPANISFDIPLQALVEMYNVEKERFNFEIITVPIMQEDTTLDVSEKFSSEVPWLVFQKPWQLTNATKYFLVEGCPRWDSWFGNIMRIIESDGTIAPYTGVLRIVNTWGAAAYPFTAEKEEELIEKEKTQMEAMSHAMFLFQHLERVAEQLREATGQRKMICLCCCHEKEFTNSMKDVLTELSDIIYFIYIPKFHRAEQGGKVGYFTATVYKYYLTWEPSKMSSAEMGRIFSLSLSEYEAMRFWAHIRSLKEGIAIDQLSEMLQICMDYQFNPSSWMFIMDQNGNLITTKGKEIVKLLSEKYSHYIVKELMQQLLKGAQTSWNWKKTLLELEQETRWERK